MTPEQRAKISALNQDLLEAKKRSQTATKTFKVALPYISDEGKEMLWEWLESIRSVQRRVQSELDTLVLSIDQKWIPVTEVGFEHLYEVSNLGYVRSATSGHILSSRRKPRNYLDVNLSRTDENGKRVQVMRFVHRLVLFAFQPTGDNSMEVNHKDRDPTNNELANLEWCTGRYNREHARQARSDNQAQSQRPKMQLPLIISGLPKTTEERRRVKKDIIDMVSKGIRQKVIAQKYGCNVRTIRKILSGQIWGDLDDAA